MSWSVSQVRSWRLRMTIRSLQFLLQHLRRKSCAKTIIGENEKSDGSRNKVSGMLQLSSILKEGLGYETWLQTCSWSEYFAGVRRVPAMGQNRSVQTDPAFTAFWVKFKDAIAKNDKQRVADMTKLPVYDWTDRSRSGGLIKVYPTLFTPRMRRCIARAKPIKNRTTTKYSAANKYFCLGKSMAFGSLLRLA